MIKTESGEMIEPRVGDVVKCHWPSTGETWEEAPVFEIHSLAIEGKAWFTEAGCADLSDCTILHRPFQVGDEIEMNCRIKGWSGDVFQTHDYEYLKAGTWEYRHKNPAWRDHSEWKGVK